MSAQNERSKQKAAKEEKIIGRESTRCVSGCSPATRSQQEHHFQCLNSSQETVTLWHISPLSGLSFSLLIGCRSSLTALPVTEKVSLRGGEKNSHYYYYYLLLLFPVGQHQKLSGLTISPFVMSQKTLPPSFSEAPTDHWSQQTQC